MKAQVFLFIVSAAKVQLINNRSSFRKVKMSVNKRERERTKYGMVFKGTICKNRPPVKFMHKTNSSRLVGNHYLVLHYI